MPGPAKVQRTASRARTPAARTRAHNRNLLRLLREMLGTPEPAEAQGRVELPAWVVKKLGLESGDRLDFVVAADVLGFCPVRLRSFNRGMLLADLSVRLPTLVLDYAASGPLVFAPLGAASYRLCHTSPAQESATATAAGRLRRFPATVSAAGRLLMPPAVISGLGVEPGDLIVFGFREDGSFTVRSLHRLIERTADALHDLVAGHSTAEGEQERQLAAAREHGVGHPLAGTWRPS